MTVQAPHFPPPVGVHSSWLRRRRILLVPIVLVAGYLTWWVSYADQHLQPHYDRLPPGSVAQARGVDYRLLALGTTDSLVGDNEGSQPGVPDFGAVWVIAELEAVQRDPEVKNLCELELLGPDEQVWDRELVTVVRQATCDPEQLRPGQPYRFEAIFQAPERYAGSLIGVALPDTATAEPTPVLIPPR